MLPPRQYVKRWGFPLAALTLIGGICLVVGTVGGWTPRQEVHSETGVWDLRAFDLTRTAVTLVGDAAYVPGAFLTPAQFEEADRLGEARIGGLFQDGASYGTRRLRILVEPGAALTVADKPGEGADWVYLTVSDTTPTTPTTPDTPDTPDTTPTTPRIVAADRFGVPASDRAAAAPSDGYLILTAVADGGRLDILEHAANWVLDKGYGANEYTVGATWLMRAYTTGVFAGPLIIMGCLLALFCFHLILWLRWRPYRVSLYCAGTCLAWFISVGLTSTKPLLTLLPWLSWDIAYTLEYLSSACAGITLYLVWIGVFPWVGSKRLNALAALIFTGAVTLALVTDSLAMQAAGP
ncbi:MAG: hypothetical protein LBK59_06630, partial [Bifidobacteriaceae bacterium]|nr:hypothetical protein [Bifidobacteriaceae bacterium]